MPSKECLKQTEELISRLHPIKPKTIAVLESSDSCGSRRAPTQGLHRMDTRNQQVAGYHRRVTQNAEICLVNNRIARAPGVDYVVACSSAALPFGSGYNCEIDQLDELGNSRA